MKLRYIVDTLGFPEPESIHSVDRRPPLDFVEPAIDAIRGCRFSPAKHQGRKVRQMVQQTVVFHPGIGPGPRREVGEFPW